MREEKTCPDCAELVLAQARLCRFCGHRFASARPTGQFAWLRRPAEDKPLPELLLDWDIELLETEDVGFFGFCSLESGDGFLLVTNRRVAFLAYRGNRKLLEWPIEQLVEVEVGGRRSRRWLRLGGETGDVRLDHFTARSALELVADQLRAALPR
jgi:hypothetical protein